MRVLIAALALAPVAGWADPSLECSVGSGSHVETSNCLVEVERKATEAMTVMLTFARESATELDEVTGRDVALPALEAAQIAWDSYVAAQCGYEGSLFGGGSGTGIAIRSCRIELTRERTRALEAALP